MASHASRTAHLVSGLSLKNGDDTIDLGDLRSRGSEFTSSKFFLVGRLNTCKAFNHDSFKGSFRSMWRLNVALNIQERGDRFLFMFTREDDIACIKRGGPWSFQKALVVLNDYDGRSPICDVPLNFV